MKRKLPPTAQTAVILFLIVATCSVLMFANAVSGQASTWTPEGPLSSARFALSAADVNGTLYAVGGTFGSCDGQQTLEAYDDATNAWTTREPMPTGRYHAAAASLDGKLYVVGGGVSCGIELATVEAYDPATNSWATRASLPASRAGLRLAAANGKLYAMGGHAPAGMLHNEVWEYDSSANTWTPKASMPAARLAFGVGVMNNLIYVVGGQDSGGNLATLQVYDPTIDTWAPKAPMPTARTALGAAALGGKLYAYGGSGASGHTAIVEAYDPATDTWAAQPSMLTPRTEFGAAASGGKLYAVAGYTGSFPGSSSVESFQPTPTPTPTPYPITPKGNGKLAFTASAGDGSRQIFTSESDGSNPTQITSLGENFTPAFSPDGTRIAFTSTRDGNLEVYVMNADGSGQQRLTAVARADQSPTWSPDGARIAFLSRRDAIINPETGTINFQIYVMSADGSNQLRLTHNSASDGHPAWSPDGTSIAFQSNREGGGRVHIYLMNPDGTNQTRVFTNPETTLEEASPAWSPDGTRLVFLGGDLGAGSGAIVTGKLYSMRADGSDAVQLTTTPTEAQDLSPTYSPNGARIAFVRAADAVVTVGSVMTIEANGGSPSAPLHDSIEGHAVSWQPVADTTAPTTTPGVTATAGTNGWYTSDVSLTLSATDGEGSGVSKITYSATGGQTIAPTDATGTSVTLTITSEGETTVTYFATDNAGNVEAEQALTLKIDKTPPAITIDSPTESVYLLGQTIAANYDCGDSVSGLSNCTGSTANGSGVDTSTPGQEVFTVTATDMAGNTENQSVNYTVTYNVCLLYDSAKAYKSGGVVPIKLQLCDFAGLNVSSADVAINAVGVTRLSDQTSLDVVTTGNANPDFDFRYDSALGGYVFNVRTTGYSAGTYELSFVVAGDPVTHRAQFRVR